MSTLVARDKAAGTAANRDDSELAATAREFWSVYYTKIKELHLATGRGIAEPLKDRNLSTTAAEHVSVFERYWQIQLANALGVPEREVGKRCVRFREYRTKSFDVCYPLKGEPKSHNSRSSLTRHV